MIFTDYLNFQKQVNTYNFDFTRNKEKINYKIEFENGKTFKQVTIFEENEIYNEKQGIVQVKIGAWFISDTDALFITLEEISNLINSEDNIKIIRDIK